MLREPAETAPHVIDYASRSPATSFARRVPLAVRVSRAEARSPSIRGDDRHAPAAPCAGPGTRAAPSVFTGPAGTRRVGERRAPACARGIRADLLCDGARHESAVGHHAVLDVVPQGNHQLARQRHNPNAPRALPGRREAPLKPSRQGTVRLPASPTPRTLD